LAFFPVLLCTSAFFLGVGLEIWHMLFHFRGDMLLLTEIKTFLFCHGAIQPTQQLLFEIWNFTIWIRQHDLHFNVSACNIWS